jgi:hypothetical protein
MYSQQRKPWARALLAPVIALLVAAGCGGVDSGGTGAVVSIGPISGFGSIIVNGVRFDEGNATIQDDDGNPVTRDQLLLGVMTRVNGSAPDSLQQSVANLVRITSELVGPVAAIDVAGATFTVLGQTVLITPDTAFDASFAGGLASLSNGSTVEVYGRYDAANGRYTATRVEARPNPAFYRLRGPVAGVNRPQSMLIIGGEKIDFSGVPPADAANAVVGNIVRAKLQVGRQSNTWVAVALPLSVQQIPDGAAATVEGRITAFTSSQQFRVNGTQVDASAATFPNGESGVVLGARVMVSGMSMAGVLKAVTVTLEGDENKANSNFQLHGTITAIDTAAMTFVLRGLTVDYSGPVQFNSGTAADLAVGQRVEVGGVLSSDGTGIKAQKIVIQGK